jgi:hypothetical protein
LFLDEYEVSSSVPDHHANQNPAQKWRAMFCPKGYISEDEVRNELDAKKACLQGKDKLGQPFTVSLVKNHNGERREAAA